MLTKLTDSWEIRLAGTPGQYSYSNFGYALLGAVVERAGKCSFAECMGAYLKELGMEHSTFWPGTVGSNAAHGRTLANGAVTFNQPGWYGSRYAIPFTGLWTSMPDLARFGSTLIAAASDVNASLHEMTVGTGHGLGPIHGTALGAPSLEHDGSGPGFHAALVVVPSKKIVVALAANGGNETQPEAAEFTRTVQAVLSAVGEHEAVQTADSSK